MSKGKESLQDRFFDQCFLQSYFLLKQVILTNETHVDYLSCKRKGQDAQTLIGK